MKRSQVIAATVVAAGIFAASLYLPAFEFNQRQSLFGLEVLNVGWLGLLAFDPRWYANVGLLVAVIANVCMTRTRIASIAALSLALASLFLPIHYFPNENAGIRVDSLGVGAYLWVVAIALAAGVNLRIPITIEATNSSPNTDARQEQPRTG